MKTKVLLITPILIITLACVLIILPKLNGTNKYFNYLYSIFYNDKIEINVSEELDIEKIDLIFENEGWTNANRLTKDTNNSIEINDGEIIRTKVFKKGTQIRDIPYSYGKQHLVVFYGNNKIGDFGHWKTNEYHTHTYKLNVFQNEKNIQISGNIIGPDQMNKYSRSVNDKQKELKEKKKN